MGIETHCIYNSPHLSKGAKLIPYEPFACSESVSGPSSIANR